MTEKLYLENCYIKEFEARVRAIRDDGVILDRTAFFPQGGGQPYDKGKLLWYGGEVEVIKVLNEGDEVVHFIKGNLPPIDTELKGVLDWERRYKIMRYHTALHVLCGTIWTEYGAQVTGGNTNIDKERARMDFNLPNIDKDLAEEIEKKVNTAIKKNAEVEIKILSREEAFKIPDLIRTKINLLPENIKQVRVVNIKGIDQQADGGPHVANTSEIGKVKVVKIKNKGKDFRRLEITLED